jgi:hypothetical protein
MLSATLITISLLAQQTPWVRHTIDASLKGADGVRLKDINGDGLPEIATGWEEGRTVRIYQHPPRNKTRSLNQWPATTVGKVCSAEDAVFADLNKDGQIDVVSACEEGQPTGVYVHWGPDWKTEPIPAASSSRRWIYTLPLQLTADPRTYILAGGKADNAELSLLIPPANPRLLKDWNAKPLAKVGWTMSLFAMDLDADSDTDILVSDRKGPNSGIFWLEAPFWPRVNIGALGEEVMFIDYGDVDGDGLKDIVAAIRPESIVWFRRLDSTATSWKRMSLPYPDNAGTAKAVAIGDLNGDGLNDVAFTCENALGGKEGVWWLEQNKSGFWRSHRVSGPVGIKFDRIELLDVDGDGNLDLITTEERTPLGVIWYENPAKN